MRNLLKRYFLLAIVFLTGASILVIELAAFRILSPYFGNTMFTTSSVIGVVLAALSIGYYLGGRMADKHPTESRFFAIIFAGGIATLFLELLIATVLPIMGSVLPITYGPFVASLVLFLVPAVILGMLSPFVVKLQKERTGSGVGTVAGDVFFWSTLGSITGSFLTGFVLIPFIGLQEIIIGTGVFLVVLGIVPLVYGSSFSKRASAVGLAILMSALAFGSLFEVTQATPDSVIYKEDGLYEQLVVEDIEYQGRPARIFRQDRSWSGGMFLDSTEHLFDYTKYYRIYELIDPDIDRALVIGGGAYTVPKSLLEDSDRVVVDVVEIEPGLLAMSEQFFDVPQSDRLNNYVQDGRRFLQDDTVTYDLIFSDAFHSLYSIPTHLTTQEFFELAKARLSSDGVFVGNMIGTLSRETPSLTLSMIRTFKEVFPNSYFVAVGSLRSYEIQNIIFIGLQDEYDFPIDEAPRSLEPVIQGLEEDLIDVRRFNLEEYTLLTDNYAPTDFYTARMLSHVSRDYEKPSGIEMMHMIRQQVSYGGRFAGGDGHKEVQDFIIAELKAQGVFVEEQPFSHTSSIGEELSLKNIIGKIRPEKNERILLGTHYDSKQFAEVDLFDKSALVPGANDSASGVAVLLELARTLDARSIPYGIDLVFFDGEEGEPHLVNEYERWFPIGSEYYVRTMKDEPLEVIVIDMVCDRDLRFKKEGSSSANLTNRLWNIGAKLYPEVFVEGNGQVIRDDHTAFLNAGIPASLIIDFEYPYWHTRGDTLDKCSPESLEIVAHVLSEYMKQR